MIWEKRVTQKSSWTYRCSWESVPPNVRQTNDSWSFGPSSLLPPTGEDGPRCVTELHKKRTTVLLVSEYHKHNVDKLPCVHVVICMSRKSMLITWHCVQQKLILREKLLQGKSAVLLTFQKIFTNFSLKLGLKLKVTSIQNYDKFKSDCQTTTF